jgi:hypothetical protein
MALYLELNAHKPERGFMEGTVTISLSDYEEMKKQIELVHSFKRRQDMIAEAFEIIPITDVCLPKLVPVIAVDVAILCKLLDIKEEYVDKINIMCKGKKI